MNIWIIGIVTVVVILIIIVIFIRRKKDDPFDLDSRISGVKDGWNACCKKILGRFGI